MPRSGNDGHADGTYRGASYHGAMERFEKPFAALSADELYAILRARQDVFVVEQECAYPDIDGKDQAATHLWYADDEHPVAAYCRVFAKPDEPGTMVIGRVLTTARGTGLGGRLLHDAVGVARRMEPDATQVWIEAQRYAIGFYEREGFRAVSEPFMGDGIVHVEMRLELAGR